MKERIMHQAILRFNSEGPTFKLDDIAKDLKISKKSIYKWYDDKEALLNHIVQHLFEVIRESKHAIYENPNLNELEKLIEVLCVYPDHEVFNYKFIPDLKHYYPNLYATVEEQLDINWEETFSLLNSCIDLGYIKPIKSALFKILFLGLYKELLLQEDEHPKERMRESIHFIIYGLKKN